MSHPKREPDEAIPMQIVGRTGPSAYKFQGAPYELGPGDQEATVFNGFDAKPPAHRLLWRAGRLRRWRYTLIERLERRWRR